MFVFSMPFLKSNNRYVQQVSGFIKYFLGIYLIHPLLRIVMQRIGMWDISWFLNGGDVLGLSFVATTVILKVPYLNKLVKL